MIVVVFTENNARILTNPDNIKFYESLSNAIVDPDLKAVEGLPPHYWRLENGKVLPMSEEHKQIINDHHAEYGVINDLRTSPIIKPVVETMPIVAYIPPELPVVKLTLLQRIINFIKNLFKRG